MKLISVVTVAITLGSAVRAQADGPDKKAPLHEWTALQQYFPLQNYNSSSRSDYGYSDVYGALVLADELGDKFSHAGRVSLVEICFKGVKADTSAAAIWAVCGTDATEFDATKYEAELAAGKVDAEEKKRLLGEAKTVIDNAKKIGAAVEDAAKTDKGLATVLAQGSDARKEWTTFAGAHKDQLALLDKLQDAVRAKKDGLGGDCFKQTQPPFQKLLKASKWPWDEDGDPMDFYYRHMPSTTEAYITILTYTACGLSLSAKGNGPYTVVANRPIGAVGPVRRGPRSLAIAKLFDPNFKPKFSDRELSLGAVRGGIKGTLSLPGTDLVSSIGTPSSGKVSKITKGDDTTKLAFAGDQVESCLQWVETKKVASVNNGNVSYEKECKKRGMVANQEGEVEVPTVFMAGIAPGISVMSIFGFPVVAYKSKEKVLTAVWGTSLK